MVPFRSPKSLSHKFPYESHFDKEWRERTQTTAESWLRHCACKALDKLLKFPDT